MARLFLVRNGRTEEGPGFEVNPRLDEVGKQQAEFVAHKLGFLPRMMILSSPQRRALEMAEPLSRAWLMKPVIDEQVTLMPLPSADVCDRAQWLVAFMKSSWSDAPREQRRWRDNCLASLAQQKEDVVIFSHFVVINMIVGAATGDDRVVVFQPDNGSITIMTAVDGKLSLVELGRQAATWLL